MINCESRSQPPEQGVTLEDASGFGSPFPLSRQLILLGFESLQNREVNNCVTF